jgi:CheY-like chemotaxis protein
MDTVPESTCRNPILVVEDDTDSRVMLATVLTLQNYRVVTAANGEEGIAMARQHRPCIILLDLMMPVMDGWEFRRRQIQDPRIADVPVVVLSALDPSRAVDLAGAAFLKKPLDFDRLLDLVRRFCLRAD